MAGGWGVEPEGGGGGAGGARLGIALALAVALAALRYAPNPVLGPARHAVAVLATTSAGTPARVAGLIERAEGLLRRGLDGRGWRWPPLSGGARVEEPPPPAPPMRYPVAGAILMPFGPGTDPLTGRKVQMDGLLLGAVAGAPVRAPVAGRVEAVRDGPAVGQEIVLEVAGRSRLRVDLVGVDAPAVRAGERVTRGQVLGRVAAVGPRTVPHVVVEVRVGGIPVDPLSPLFFGARA